MAAKNSRTSWRSSGRRSTSRAAWSRLGPDRALRESGGRLSLSSAKARTKASAERAAATKAGRDRSVWLGSLPAAQAYIAEHAHALGARLGRRDVGDVGLRRREVARARAREQPRREQHPQRIGEAEPEIGGDRGDQAGEQHRPAPEPVAEPAEDGREEELRERIARHHPGDRGRRRAEMHAVEREQRDDDAEAEQIDEDDQKEDGHGWAIDSVFRRPRIPLASTRASTPALEGSAIALGWIGAQRPSSHARRNWLRFVILIFAGRRAAPSCTLRWFASCAALAIDHDSSLMNAVCVQSYIGRTGASVKRQPHDL